MTGSVAAMQNILRLEIHQLLTPFASVRVAEPRRLQQLMRCIERQGQLMPVVAVAAEKQKARWVLIDGYRRWEVLRQLGQDLIWVDGWDCSVDDALLLCLARGGERAWQAIEEAALICELSQRHEDSYYKRPFLSISKVSNTRNVATHTGH